MAAHQAPLSLGFSRQEHWSGSQLPEEALIPWHLHLHPVLPYFDPLCESPYHAPVLGSPGLQDFLLGIGLGTRHVFNVESGLQTTVLNLQPASVSPTKKKDCIFLSLFSPSTFLKAHLVLKD